LKHLLEQKARIH